MEEPIRLVEDAIKDSIDAFVKEPTIYFEEAHIHSLFYCCFMKRLTKVGRKNIAQTNDGVKVPLFMNEYTTVNHYSREGDKREVANGRKGYGPGSIDFIFLNKEWIEINDYNTVVNKFAKTRISSWKNQKKADQKEERRFDFAIEFKFFHYGKKYSIDSEDCKNEWPSYTQKAKLGQIEKAMELDIEKLEYENPKHAYIVCFNSEVPVIEKDIGNLINNELKKPENLKIFYAQSGIPKRFKDGEKFSIPKTLSTRTMLV